MINKIKILLNKKQQSNFIFLFIGILITAFLEMIGIGSIPIFINLLLKPDQVFLYLPQNSFISDLANKDYAQQVLFASIILISIFIFKNIFIFSVNYLQTAIFQNVKIINSKRMFQAYLTSPYSFHLNRNPAILTRDILGEVHHASKFLDLLMICMREILVIIVIFILLLLVDPITSLIIFSVVTLFAVIFNYSTRKKVTHLSKLSQIHRGRQVKLINQVFGAIKDAKILNREMYFVNEFDNETKGAERINFFSKVINAVPRLSIEILGIITILFITALFIFSGHPMETMIPTLSLLGVATIRLIPSFNLLSGTIALMRHSYVSFNLIAKELSKLKKYDDIDNQKVIDNFESEDLDLKKIIEIKNISYEYPASNKKIIKNISFKIKSGNFIGIIGSTGAGKSTLVDIILGLLEPSEGSIDVDNKNINVNYPAWQKQIGYIPQDIYILDDSVRRNVAFGIPENEINEEDVKRSVRLAQLSNFILDLPQGLDTVVGNRGIRLSGGQRQRLGIARALYRNSRILILDEATSSLDVETEKKVIEDIENLSGNYTIIIITHRLSTIKNCDDIVLLSEGKLIDQGKFEDLLSRHKNLKTDILKRRNEIKNEEHNIKTLS